MEVGLFLEHGKVVDKVLSVSLSQYVAGALNPIYLIQMTM